MESINGELTVANHDDKRGVKLQKKIKNCMSTGGHVFEYETLGLWGPECYVCSKCHLIQGSIEHVKSLGL